MAVVRHLLIALLLGVEKSPALTASFSIAMSFPLTRLPDQLLLAGLYRLLELVGEVTMAARNLITTVHAGAPQVC